MATSSRLIAGGEDAIASVTFPIVSHLLASREDDVTPENCVKIPVMSWDELF